MCLNYWPLGVDWGRELKRVAGLLLNLPYLALFLLLLNVNFQNVFPVHCLLLLLSRFSRSRICATPYTEAHQALHPWDSPGKNTGVGCHFHLQCMKVKSESEVAQSCPTPSDPMNCVHCLDKNKSKRVVRKNRENLM